MNIDTLLTKTVFELKSYAKKNGIDLSEATKKDDMLKVIEAFIPEDKAEEVAVVYDKVAVFSKRNLHWNGVGNLKMGYNIVTMEHLEKWLTHKSVRSATPEEVSGYYGK
jgi:hypothetical protein